MKHVLTALVLGALTATPVVAQNVRISTSMGDITVALDKAKAPISTENFVKYVSSGHYTGTVFHRVISDFMIQGGGMDDALVEKATKAPIELESGNGLTNVRGTIAMARTGVPHSATAQFFINVKDNPMLDKANARDGHGYAVFGKVTAGMDIVDKIRAVPVGNQGPHQNVPLKPILIKKVTVVKS